MRRSCLRPLCVDFCPPVKSGLNHFTHSEKNISPQNDHHKKPGSGSGPALISIADSLAIPTATSTCCYKTRMVGFNVPVEGSIAVRSNPTDPCDNVGVHTFCARRNLSFGISNRARKRVRRPDINEHGPEARQKASAPSPSLSLSLSPSPSLSLSLSLSHSLSTAECTEACSKEERLRCSEEGIGAKEGTSPAL